MLKNTEQFNY